MPDSTTATALRTLHDTDDYAYRSRVLELLGATRTTTDPVGGPLRRRAEGTLDIPDHHRTVRGTIVFAVGGNGAGTAADVRSKDGAPSARSILRTTPDTDFVLLITTGPPPPRIRELAAATTRTFILAGTERPAVWPIGIPELLDRLHRTPPPEPPLRRLLARIPLLPRMRARPAPHPLAA